MAGGDAPSTHTQALPAQNGHILDPHSPTVHPIWPQLCSPMAVTLLDVSSEKFSVPASAPPLPDANTAVAPWYLHKPWHPQIALTLHSCFTPSERSWMLFLSI